MLGSSGTVTTLAGIHLALPRYTRALVDGSVLTFEQISVVSAHLAGLDLAGRAANPCVGRERADLVLSGCAILDAICATWPVGRLRVADRGVREGILLDLMRRDVAQWVGEDGAARPEPARRHRAMPRCGAQRQAAQAVLDRVAGRQLNDPYVAEARRLGYRSRAAFKLIELDDRFRLLLPGRRVVDLGCAPGGWTQVAVERVGACAGRGAVIGIDLAETAPVGGATILRVDIHDPRRPLSAIRAALRGRRRHRAERHGAVGDRPCRHRPSADRRARRGGILGRHGDSQARRRFCRQGLSGRRRGRAAGAAQTAVSPSCAMRSRRRAGPSWPRPTSSRKGFAAGRKSSNSRPLRPRSQKATWKRPARVSNV